MHRFSFLHVLAFVAFSLLLAVPQTAKAGDERGPNHPAAVFIKGLGEKALSSLTAKDIPSIEREKRVRSLLGSYFDVPTIGKYALGPYWKSATEREKGEYLDLFEDMIVKTYTLRFSEYSGQSLKVVGAMSAGGTSNDAIVSSQIIQQDGPPVEVEWRVRNKGGQMKVIDVVVENISMSITQRSDFASVIQGGGGKIAALIDSLRLRKNGAIAQKM